MVGPADQRGAARARRGLHRLGNGARARGWWSEAAGRSEHERGYFVEPTIFADVDNRMTIAQEEIFGPVVAVIPYDGEDRGGRDRQRLGLRPLRQRLERRRRARTAVARRRAHRQRRRQPSHARHRRAVRRLQASGLGREYGLEGIDEYVELQQVTAPRPQPAASLRRRTSSSSVLAAQSSAATISSPRGRSGRAARATRARSGCSRGSPRRAAPRPPAGCPTPRRPPPRPRRGAAVRARRPPAPGRRSCARRRGGPSRGSRPPGRAPCAGRPSARRR